MRLSGVLSAAVLAAIRPWSATAENVGFDATVSDLAQATALSYDARTATLSLDPATFFLEAPVIVNGLYNITELGAKYIRQTHGAGALNDELAQSAIYDLAIFVEAQRALMQDLTQKSFLVSEFASESKFAEAIRALEGATFGAEDALARIIPTRTQEGEALFGVMNGAIEDALKAYT